MDLRVVMTLISLSSFLYTFQTQESKTPDVTDLSFRNMDFAMNLYRRISRHHDNNIVFSPLSVSVSLATLLLAAGGSTRAQIAGGLNLASLDDDDEVIPQLFQDLLSNISLIQQNTALFVDHRFDLEQVFSHQVKRFFGADVIAVEFGKTDVGRNVINDYISKKTGGKVREMVKSVEPLTQMMLINTVFFKGDWQRPFDPNSTEAGRFYVDKYNIVQVPLMFAEDKFFTTVDSDVGARVLRLPYRGGASLLIILPDASVDYTAIEDELTADRIFRWIKNLKPVKMEVHVPKFQLEQRYDMCELLPHLGISSVFLDSANLTGLSKDVGVKVSQVMHTAVMDVDEAGTTAASVTSAGITTYSLPATFRVDRPFFFFLYHEASRSLLFMGRVIDPTKNSQ
ncbi:protein Z-dependent protease inhibitor isoform X1 [Triplophysa dalaica]|uniref:protein Z-dependent protease inhibitor isoform X1 n=1 Tax=Triplophysa dalaica TaxID=1582913 RepID=UPI0024DF7B1E|nr:protein Z-dependent protease inhibitor isoform X1 [Triplophysa dalaica]XP_056623130.1 protein Z-dependent protease inhibitor isoform X1 [Triplophysa dalaica]